MLTDAEKTLCASIATQKLSLIADVEKLRDELIQARDQRKLSPDFSVYVFDHAAKNALDKLHEVYFWLTHGITQTQPLFSQGL